MEQAQVRGGWRLLAAGLTAALAVWLAAAGVARAQEPAAAAGGGAPPPEAVSQALAVSVNLLEIVFKGGWIIYPLGVCSVIMLAVTIERFLALRRSKILPAVTAQTIRTAVAMGGDDLDVIKVMHALEGRTDTLARIAVAGLRKGNRPVALIEKAMEDAGAKEVARLQRNNRILSSVAGVAPLLGLLGTVTGIIRTFMTVAVQSEALGRPELLAGGIYEALVATAVGLGIAILSLVLYYYFQERIDRLATEIDDVLSDFVSRLPARS